MYSGLITIDGRMLSKNMRYNIIINTFMQKTNEENEKYDLFDIVLIVFTYYGC